MSHFTIAPMVALVAMALDWLSPKAVPFVAVRHPVRFIGDIIAIFESKLNKGSPFIRVVSGAVLTLGLVGLALWLGVWLEGLLEAGFGVGFSWLGYGVEAWIVAALLAQRELGWRARLVADELATGNLIQARELLRHLVGRKTHNLSGSKVASATLESLAENFTDAVIAPLFWYLVGGLGGLFALKTINTLDSTIGYKTPQFNSFGMVAAHLDTVANFIPARLAMVLLWLASPLKKWRAIAKTVVAHSGRHSSLNAGVTEAVMAAALAIRLGGTRHYPNQQPITEKPIGFSPSPTTVAKCYKGLAIYYKGCGATAVLLGGLVILQHLF